jgi:hypothetical protein
VDTASSQPPTLGLSVHRPPALSYPPLSSLLLNFTDNNWLLTATVLISCTLREETLPPADFLIICQLLASFVRSCRLLVSSMASFSIGFSSLCRIHASLRMQICHLIASHLLPATAPAQLLPPPSFPSLARYGTC